MTPADTFALQVGVPDYFQNLATEVVAFLPQLFGALIILVVGWAIGRLLGGAVRGLAGAMFAIMILGYYSDPNSFPTFGFDAIAVSLLGANNPLAVVPAGILFGGLDAGGQYIGFTLDVPSELVDGVIGLIVLFVAVPELFRMAGRYTGLGGEHQ